MSSPFGVDGPQCGAVEHWMKCRTKRSFDYQQTAWIIVICGDTERTC